MKRKLLTSIPDRYILPRWTMKATYAYDNRKEVLWRFTNNDVAKEVTLLTIWSIRSKVNSVHEDGPDSVTEIQKLDSFLNDLLEEQSRRKNSRGELNTIDSSTMSFQTGNILEQNDVSDPICSAKTKGRLKVSTRLKSSIELVTNPRKQKMCSHCGRKGHYKTGCQQRKLDMARNNVTAAKRDHSNKTSSC
uniref:uncharacterized protein LOC122598890 n=1 Tax=Erigeron canadensis TaxID=72917 RepID=UPI001CB9B458|nr:uncharacterized protein LOC122598890 [Erigeron canadensis]